MGTTKPKQVRLEGKGGVVQIYDLPLSEPIEGQLAKGELVEVKPAAKKAPAKKPAAKKG